MPRNLYGESYSGIASQELSRDSARDQRYFQSLAARRAVEQMRHQQQQAAFQNQMAVNQLSANLAMQREGRNREAMQSREGRQERLMDDIIQNRQFYDKLKFEREKLGSETGVNKARIAEREMNEATESISDGTLKAGSNFDELFPNLDTTQRKRLQVMAKSVQEFEDEQAAAAEAAAKAANAQIKLATSAKQDALKAELGEMDVALAEKLKGPNMPRGVWSLGMGDGTEGTLQAEAAKARSARLGGVGSPGEVRLDSKELSELLNQIMKNRAYSDYVTFDTESGNFVPVIQRRQPSVGRTAPAAGGAQPDVSGAIRRAQRAISLGADPNAVNDRLQKLYGVSLP